MTTEGDHPVAHWPAHRSAVLDWLIGEARQLPDGPSLLRAFCTRLVDAGIKLARASIHVRTLHPQLFGLGFYWHRGQEEIRIFQAPHGVRDTELYRRSPMRLLFDEGATVLRQRLDQPEARFEFPLYAELQEAGLTEYLALPLRFSDGVVHGSTWSTDRAGGFTPAEVALIEDLLPLVGLLVEIHLKRRIAINLLNTYVGPHAGERILAGQITRGSGDSVEAAIWFSDLRGFTAMSERHGRDELLDRLNQYFDCMAEPVTAAGGEILKFIGDAMLAVFPLAEAQGREDACAKALTAALEARLAMAELNRRRRESGEETLNYGIALHVGKVMYGNIGSRNRLDFTVIGPAVNLASRIEGLCRRLGPPILMSDRFAEQCGGDAPLRSLGRHRLAGVEREVEIFSPEEAAGPANGDAS
jgi:adenylate cyclase